MSPLLPRSGKNEKEKPLRLFGLFCNVGVITFFIYCLGGKVKKSIAKFCLVPVVFGWGFASLQAQTETNLSPREARPTMPKFSGNQECKTEIMLSYFPEEFVGVTLEKFNVPQAQRSAIKTELSGKDKEVIAIVEERAAKMSPNPLKDPQHRQEAIKIFKDTLYEMFSGVMQKHGVNDKEQIQAMLDDVQQQKAKYFAKCMEKMRPPQGGMHPPGQQQNKDKGMNQGGSSPYGESGSDSSEYDEEYDY
jgi:hypothetical protein